MLRLQWSLPFETHPFEKAVFHCLYLKGENCAEALCIHGALSKLINIWEGGVCLFVFKPAAFKFFEIFWP